MIELMMKGALATIAVYAVFGIATVIGKMINNHKASNIMFDRK